MPKLITSLPLEQATTILDRALEAGAEHGMKPLTVVVLDAGGHMIALKRSDGSGILRIQVAVGKAYGALGMGIPSRSLAIGLADRPAFQNALAVASEGRVIPAPGGVLVTLDGDTIIGAVGVSGDTSAKDEYCAIEGIKAAGLFALPPEPEPNWQGV